MDEKVLKLMAMIEKLSKPTRHLEVLTAMNLPSQVKAVELAMSSTPEILALKATVQQPPAMLALEQAMRPTRAMLAFEEAMRPSLAMRAFEEATRLSPQMETWKAAMQLPPQMEALEAAMAPIRHMEAFRSVVNEFEMEAIQAAISPTRQIELALKLLRDDAIHPALKPLSLFNSLKAFPAVLAFGTSFGVLGAQPLLTESWWTAPHSPGVLDALSSAGQVFAEAGHQQQQLTELITQFIQEPIDSEFVTSVDVSAIGQELATVAITGDLNSLSDPAKRYVSGLFALIYALLAIIATIATFRGEMCFLQPKIFPGMTTGQIGKTIRRAACNVPLEVLRDYRFVRGDAVRLRDSPTMKGGILPVLLIDGDLLEVISSDNRDWYHVAVVGQSGTEGWISRRYAKPLAP